MVAIHFLFRLNGTGHGLMKKVSVLFVNGMIREYRIID